MAVMMRSGDTQAFWSKEEEMASAAAHVPLSFDPGGSLPVRLEP